MKTLLSLLLLLALGASAATGIKISEYPNTPVLTNSELFIVAVTNVTPATNRNISYGQLRTLLASNNFVGSFNGDGRNVSNVVAAYVSGTLSNNISGNAATATNLLNTFYLDRYAVGDGSTDDSLNIENCIAVAGEKGTIIFGNRKTYKVSRSLTPLTGQHWIGNGSVLKRCNAIVTTTTNNLATGNDSTTFTVADASNFRVGMFITFFTNQFGGDNSNHKITNISGNTMTITLTIRPAFPTGACVVSSFPLIANTGQFEDFSNYTDVVIEGLELDGNRSGNTNFIFYSNHSEIELLQDRCILRNLYIHDAQCEGISFGGHGSIIDSCRLINIVGNAIHLGRANGVRIVNNYIDTCNILGTGPGHQDGGIIASDLVTNTYVSGNFIAHALSGIGSWEFSDDVNLIAIGNTIQECTNAVSMISGGSGPTYFGPGSTFIGNHFINCGKFYVTSANGQGYTGARDLKIQDNFFWNTMLYVDHADRVTISGNLLSEITNITEAAISLIETRDVDACNNRVSGGAYGLYVADDVIGNRNLSIRNNQFVDNINYGVFVIGKTTNTVIAQNDFSVQYTNSDINLNQIALKVYEQSESLSIVGNSFYNPTNGGPAGNSMNLLTSMAVVSGNTINNYCSVYPLLLDTTSTNNLVSGNFMTSPIRDLGQMNKIHGNYVSNILGSFMVGDSSSSDPGTYGGSVLTVGGPGYFRQSTDASKYVGIGASGNSGFIMTGGMDIFFYQVGKVGIDTFVGPEKFSVSGSIYASSNLLVKTLKPSSTNALIMVAPDGGTWILRVGNDGSLTTTTNASGL